jgi:hypothetical protein
MPETTEAPEVPELPSVIEAKERKLGILIYSLPKDLLVNVVKYI